MIEKITETLKKELPEFNFDSSKDDDKNTASITARNGLTRGFDVDIALSSKEITISHASKIKTFTYMLVLGITVLLTYLFGGWMLSSMGCVADVGNSSMTLKIFYIIPVLIFLIPSSALFLITKKLSPKDDALLKKVSKLLSGSGFDSKIE